VFVSASVGVSKSMCVRSVPQAGCSIVGTHGNRSVANRGDAGGPESGSGGATGKPETRRPTRSTPMSPPHSGKSFCPYMHALRLSVLVCAVLQAVCSIVYRYQWQQKYC